MHASSRHIWPFVILV